MLRPFVLLVRVEFVVFCSVLTRLNSANEAGASGGTYTEKEPVLSNRLHATSLMKPFSPFTTHQSTVLFDHLQSSCQATTECWLCYVMLCYVMLLWVRHKNMTEISFYSSRCPLVTNRIVFGRDVTRARKRS